MGSLRLRVRTPTGQIVVVAEAGVTPSNLRALIEQQTSIPASRQQLLVGYPPSRMSDDHACSDGEIIIVRDCSDGEGLAPRAGADPAPAPRAEIVTAVPQQSPLALVGQDDACVAARKVIPADNNCLFAALIYALHLDLDPQVLREVVKTCVLADPEQWSEPLLGMEPARYCDWITQKDHWGGEIEMQILSRHFRKQVAAFDIVSLQLFRYGEEMGYDEVICLLYDGIHYDAAVLLPAEGVPEEFGTTVFAASNEVFLAKVRSLCGELHSSRQFTDTSKFTLRCLVCSAGLVGERGAQEHAKTTGHINFSEY